MKPAPIFELPRFKRHDKKQKPQHAPKEAEPLPWNEGETDLPQPPFLPAA